MEPEITKKANEIRSSLLRKIHERVELLGDQTQQTRERLYNELEVIERMASLVNLLDPGHTSLGMYSAGAATSLIREGVDPATDQGEARP